MWRRMPRLGCTTCTQRRIKRADGAMPSHARQQRDTRPGSNLLWLFECLKVLVPKNYWQNGTRAMLVE